MTARARILLNIVTVMAVMVTSSVFHNCYYLEGPELAENTPPVVNYRTVEPQLIGFVDVDLTDTTNEFFEFTIGEIWDPDPEESMRGLYGIDYDAYLAPDYINGGIISIHRKTDEDEGGGGGGKGFLWKASFKIEKAHEFMAGNCHEVIAVISDRAWVDTPEAGPIEVPETTTPAYVRWIIRAYDDLNPLDEIYCTN